MPAEPDNQRSAEGAFSTSDEDRANVERFGTAVDHLHAFAATFNPGDVVDEESKLTGYDLHVILDLAEKMHRMARDAPKP